MKTVLITGISGFAGSFLAEYLVSKHQYTIHGTYLSDSSLQNLSAITNELSLHQIDLTEKNPVEKLIAELKPDLIFHLAAFPSPSASFDDPSGFLQNNINAELFILEALRKNDLQNTRTLVVSSAEVYGLVGEKDLPINEDTPLRPVSPYGVSKIAQDFLALQYHLSYKLQTVRVRPFGHIGPRLSPQFAASAFAKKIAEIENGKREPVLTVGNLEARRDLTDVRDMVQAYDVLLQRGISGDVYNIGRGTSYRMQELVDILLSFSKVKIEIQQDKKLLRPNDIPELRCDNTKMQKLTGWEATRSIHDSLRDVLEYWRGIV